MHIGYHNDKHIYQMGSGESRMDLNQVTSEKDLGITFQDDLQFTKHLSDKVKKANSILGLIHRSFQHIDNEMFIHSTRLSSVHTWSMLQVCGHQLSSVT